MTTIKGKRLRLVRLDGEGNPVGSAFDLDGQLSLRIEDNDGEVSAIPVAFPETVTIEMVVGEIGLGAYVALTGEMWRLDETCVEMGGAFQFDYTGLFTPLAERLTNCYEYAALAFFDYHFTRQGLDKVDEMERVNVPVPTTLVHGTYSSPETRGKPIAHAWVVLSNGQIWEPITSLICDAQKFYEFCEPHDLVTYGETEVRVNMMRHGHYGPWHT